MKNAGQPVPKGAAAARSWNKWGKPFPIGTSADKIPQGAVVVFSRGTDPAKGHVSFFVGGDPKNVRVLGGNQHHEVNETNFPRSNIIGIRLPADLPSGPSAAMPSGESIHVPPGASLFQAKAPGIMDKLMADFPPLSEIQAAGVLGNIGTECNGFLDFQEKGVPPGSGGFGWCQWTGRTPKNPRRANFEKFCQDHGFSMTSDAGNYGFLKLELETSEKEALKALKATKTLKDAVRTFEVRFERAGKKNFSSRDTFARIALEAYRQAKAHV